MGHFLDKLRSRPVCEFIGGPLDGSHLPIDPAHHPGAIRVKFVADEGGAAVVDVYHRDPVGSNKFRFVRRESGTARTTHQSVQLSDTDATP